MFVRSFSFFFNDPATTEIYTLSLHDALPIFQRDGGARGPQGADRHRPRSPGFRLGRQPEPRDRSDARRLRCGGGRSEEHTSELQSRVDLVCRLLLEKKKKKKEKWRQ